MLLNLLVHCLALHHVAAARGMRLSPGSEEESSAHTYWPKAFQWSSDLPVVSSYFSKASFYNDWQEEFKAPRSDPETSLHQRIKQLHPNHTITAISQPTFQLLEYANVPDHGLNIRKRPDVEAISQQIYIPAARRREGGGSIAVSIKFAAFDLHWSTSADSSESFLAYYGTWSEGYGVIEQWWLLQLQEEQTAASSADLLIHAVSHYANQLHDELWEFSYPGFWKKSKSLFRSVDQTGNWDDIILDETLKRDLREDVIGFFSKESLYKGLAVPWKRGIILMGEPGNGKTITLKALQHQLLHEMDVVPLYVKTFSQFGSDEAGIHEIFKHARAVSPCLLIIEDLDSLLTELNRSLFLNELDGLEDNDGIFVLATTNYFDKLDPSVSKRPSRFDRKYAFPSPEPKERRAYGVYWQHKLRDRPELEIDDALLDRFTVETRGFSFAYLKEVFVSTLLLIAGGEKMPFSQLLLAQAHALGKQLNETAAVPAIPVLGLQTPQFTFGHEIAI